MTWWVAMAWAGATFRGAVGGQLETQGHGILDLGVVGDGWSAQLYTDTADLRAWRQGSRGKVDLGLRAAAFAAGMWITPWEGGAPALQRAQRVAYVGPDLRAQVYLGRGWYGEGAGFVQRHVFRPLGAASTLRMADRWWTHGEVTLGGWFADGERQLRLTGGIDRTDAAGSGVVTAPFAQLDARWQPEGALVPAFAAFGRAAEGADAVVATRVGGMTPYHVPLAGAAWAELWVEDVVAGRAELLGRALDRDARVVVHGAVDLVAWRATVDPLAPSGDGWAPGLEVGARWTRGGAFAEGKLGYAPTLPRRAGVWPVPVFVLVGLRSASSDG